jgi:formylglycine-generating enzyme required for sulfatase activity
LRALDEWLEAEEARGYQEIFADHCSEENRSVYLRDAERRTRSSDEAAARWWQALQAMAEKDIDVLTLAEPLAQHGLTVEEIFQCLPEQVDSTSLSHAVELARNIKSGRRTGSRPISLKKASLLTPEEMRQRLDEIKSQPGWRAASAEARAWWDRFEGDPLDGARQEIALLLVEEIAQRKMSLADFYAAMQGARTENITAVFHYFDYLKAKENALSEDAVLTTADDGWWMKPAMRKTLVRGWTAEQIQRRLDEMKPRLGWEGASPEIRAWWTAFETENRHRPALSLRLAEELADRNASLADFHRARSLAGTRGIHALLFYLDYLRLTTEQFEFETLRLDPAGVVIDRRRNVARQFLEELAPGLALEMVEVPGGTFLMGTADEDVETIIEEYTRYGIKREDAENWVNWERPRHEVTVPPFYIGKFTITQEQWEVVAGWEKIERDLKPDPSNFKGADRPVEKISWFDAKEFCARLAKKTGRAYRLPTEAEWEYACRAGTVTPFAFGETITAEIVNYHGNYPYAKAVKGPYRGQTIPVGSLGIANDFGLFDMHGNVWEWCEDAFFDSYEGAPSDGSARLSEGDSSTLVLRGGSYFNYARYCRAAIRNRYDARVIDNNVGLRVVVSARTG